MNHILRMQAERAEHEAAEAALREKIQSFKIHLNSDKFRGQDADGSRKDWIATADVLAFLESL